MSNILVMNATEFLNRPIYLYALGDIRLKNPVPLKKAAFILTGFIVYTVPLIMIFGLIMSPFYLAFILGPPIIVGSYATKPLGGRTIFEHANVMVEWVSEPKGWTDFKANSMREEKHSIISEIWISRRRELNLLAEIVEGKADIVEEEDEEHVETK